MKALFDFGGPDTLCVGPLDLFVVLKRKDFMIYSTDVTNSSFSGQILTSNSDESNFVICCCRSAAVRPATLSPSAVGIIAPTWIGDEALEDGEEDLALLPAKKK